MATVIRDQVVAFARTLDGLSADPACPARRDAYRRLVAPGETEQRTREMEQNSGCELVCRAILRRFIIHRLLERPYVSQHAGADLLAIALEAGAAHGATWPAAPGDILIVGGGIDGGGDEHAWTVLDTVASPYDEPILDLVSGLDGGQRDGGNHQAIAIRSHELQGGRDVTATYNRRIRYVLDFDAIFRRFGRKALFRPESTV
jgi:hypothetical protein